MHSIHLSNSALASSSKSKSLLLARVDLPVPVREFIMDRIAESKILNNSIKLLREKRAKRL